jgi:hypothetical protein
MSQETEKNITPGEMIDVEQKKSGEIVDIRSRKKEKELGGDAGHWLKKVEEYNSDPEGMIVRDGNIKMVSPDKISQDMYQVPLTKSTFVSTIRKKVKDVSLAVTCLSMFLLRVIKLKKGKVVFKKDES